MPRPLRSFVPGHVYHVMSRGDRRLEIFHDDVDYKTFLQELFRFKKALEVTIFHYVLMPNHFHMILQTKHPNGPEFMRKLKVAYAIHYLRRHNLTGHVWQNRYKNFHVDTDAYLLASGNYVEMNPVRANLVASPDQWPYSSFHFHAHAKPDPIVNKTPLFDSLGSTDEERRRSYGNQLSMTRSF